MSLHKFETNLIEEYNYHVRVFNENYANKTIYGNAAIKAEIQKAKVDILYSIIKALQKALLEDK